LRLTQAFAVVAEKWQHARLENDSLKLLLVVALIPESVECTYFRFWWIVCTATKKANDCTECGAISDIKNTFSCLL